MAEKTGSTGTDGQENFVLESKVNSYKLQLDYQKRELIDVTEEIQQMKCKIENEKTISKDIGRKYKTV